jgi:hypothetical protein
VSTEIAICNTALSHLGDEAGVASIDPPEGSPQAGHCAVFYPIARDEALERHAWGFATAEAALAPLSLTRPGWDYAFAAPSDTARPQALLPAGWAKGEPTAEFTVEVDDNGASIILTNAVSPTLKYTRRVTNPAAFSALFVSAVGWKLASLLAGPVLKGDAGRTASAECFKMYEYHLNLAAGSDANGQRVNAPKLPASIKARL